ALGWPRHLRGRWRGDGWGGGGLLAVLKNFFFKPFGFSPEGEPVELVNLRLSAIGKAASRLHFDRLALDPRALAGESGERMVSFSRGAPRIAARLVARAALESEPIPGPAVLESYDTQIVVPPRCTADAAGAGCIAIEMEDSDG